MRGPGPGCSPMDTTGTPRSLNRRVTSSSCCGSTTTAPPISRSSREGRTLQRRNEDQRVATRQRRLGRRGRQLHEEPETRRTAGDRERHGRDQRDWRAAPVRSRCAPRCGRYPNRRATSITRSRVCGSTWPRRFSACDTVVGETPAALATSTIFVRRAGPSDTPAPPRPASPPPPAATLDAITGPDRTGPCCDETGS